jgi:hypothetical protein
VEQLLLCSFLLLILKGPQILHHHHFHSNLWWIPDHLFVVVAVAVVAFDVSFVVPELPVLLPCPQLLGHEYLLNLFLLEQISWAEAMEGALEAHLLQGHFQA